jgi:oxygen-independent coproporphyrinogen-3 oxidase
VIVNGNDALGLYVSIPFCRSKCTYCNFASGVYPASEHERYVTRVIEDMASSRSWASQMGLDLPRTVDTIYLGGGTPSLLSAELIGRLFAAVRSQFDVQPNAEITVECAPGQLADASLEAMAAAGVNRVSLGVQSFIDREAHSSGRLHSRAIVTDDLARLQKAGISNLNIDLIAGLAGQTLASWEESLDVLIDSGVPHASVYMLEVDEDSRLGREMLAGGIRYHAELVPSDDTVARMYSMAIERLDAVGLCQYEISNFCRKGFASRHNLRYWHRSPYLGLGLDASSMIRAFLDESNPSKLAYVLRSTTTDDLKTYLDGVNQPETAWLSPASQHEEAWFLGLRLNEGVDVSGIEREFGTAAAAAALRVIPRLERNGLVMQANGRVVLTAQGRLLSNEVFQEFLGLADGCEPSGIETQLSACSQTQVGRYLD